MASRRQLRRVYAIQMTSPSNLGPSVQAALRFHTRRPRGTANKDRRTNGNVAGPNVEANRRKKAAALAKVDAAIMAAKLRPCADCGQSYPHPAMEFDHVRGEKLFSIANFRRQPTLAIQRLHDEIAKCDLVCAICHRIREWNRLHPEAPL
jgi:hypothetical protein